MTQWIAVSRTAHADSGYLPREGYHHVAQQMIAPVMLAELPKALPYFVIGLLAADDGLLPVAVLGVEQAINLYVHPDGRWLGKYVPAALRGYPFGLANKPGAEGRNDKTLSIDAHYITEQGGTPLFKDGELTAPVAETLAFLTQREHNRRATQAACNLLEHAGVLTRWALQVPIGDGHKQVNGLYRVDEQALNALDADTYATLQGTPMQLAYAQLYSMSQIDQLTQRHSLQEKIAHAQPPHGLDAMLGDDDDDLEFDFD